MNMKWIRGKPIFIILLFAILILFLSVVIILAGQQGSYLKTSSTGGISPDDFLEDCLDMSDLTYEKCIKDAESEDDTCHSNNPYGYDIFQPGATPPPGYQEWVNMCQETLDAITNNCDEVNKADYAECERIASGLKGIPTPDPTPLEDPFEQTENTPNPTP